MSSTSWQLQANQANAVERDDEDLTYLWLAEHASGRIRYLTISRSHNSQHVIDAGLVEDGRHKGGDWGEAWDPLGLLWGIFCLAKK